MPRSGPLATALVPPLGGPSTAPNLLREKAPMPRTVRRALLAVTAALSALLLLAQPALASTSSSGGNCDPMYHMAVQVNWQDNGNLTKPYQVGYSSTGYVITTFTVHWLVTTDGRNWVNRAQATWHDNNRTQFHNWTVADWGLRQSIVIFKLTSSAGSTCTKRITHG